MLPNFNCVELFSGGGGLALGVERAGFHHLALIEWNRHARDTIALNNGRGVYRRKWPLLEQADVREVDFSAFKGNVALVAGGPPCQPFSMGGVHRGDLDARNMFPEAIRAVREIEPQAFLFENVRGLARQSFRPYIEYILAQLRHPWLRRKDEEFWQDHAKRLQHVERSRIGGDGPEYWADCRVISCSNFGAPQLRERVIFIGVRKDLGVEWSWPTPTHSKAALIDEQYVTGEYWKRHHKQRPPVPESVRTALAKTPFIYGLDPLEPWRTVRDQIATVGAPAKVKNRVSTEHNQHVLIPGARVYAGHSGSSLDWPAKALKAGVHGVPGGENMVVLDDGSVRYFTVREAASLQGFPADYLFSGIWGECMRQIGNAVPVMVAAHFASAIRKILVSAQSQTRMVAG